jgi:hypothetical protein
MDTNQLVKDIKARFNINFQKQQLHEKYSAKLIVADQGGLWKATPELIGFLSISDSTHCVVLDTYEKPIHVNINQLQKKLRETYNLVMEQWYNEYTELENNR